jgi:hypothetical protein
MSRKTHFATVLIVALLSVSVVGTAPALAAPNSTAFVCDGGGLQSILSSITTLIVTIAALVAIVGGAGFTLASAARPTEDYQEKRNQTIIYGGGTLLVLYGANAITSQIAESLEFSCILPFF